MKKETSENILYFPLYFYFWLHALLPLKILYILSDILFFSDVLHSTLPEKTGISKYERFIS